MEETLELKKELLYPHIPFVEKMLKKVQGSKFEMKWKNTLENITQKRLSKEQIQTLDTSLKTLKTKLNYKDHHEKSQNNSNSNTTAASGDESAENKTNESAAETSPSTPAEKSASEKELTKDPGDAVFEQTAEQRKRNLDYYNEYYKQSTSQSWSPIKHPKYIGPEVNPLKQIDQVLNSVSVGNTQDTDVIQSLEAVIGRENLLKIQNVLLKDAIKKSNVTEVLSNEMSQNESKIDSQVSIKKELFSPKLESAVAKRPTARKKTFASPKKDSKATPNSASSEPKRKKPNELELLLQDVNEMYDRDELVETSLRRRTCTQAKPPEDPNLKYNLPAAFVLVERLDLSKLNLPVRIKSESASAENITHAEDVTESVEPIAEKSTPIVTKTSPKGTKKRGQYLWSKGIIKKKAKYINKNAELDWENVSEEEGDREPSDVVRTLPMRDFLSLLDTVKESDVVDSRKEIIRIKVIKKRRNKSNESSTPLVEEKTKPLPKTTDEPMVIGSPDPKRAESLPSTSSSSNKPLLIPLASAASSQLQIDDYSKNAQSDEVIVEQQECEIIELLDDDDDDTLRPWLDKREFRCMKQKNVCKRMLSKYCLAAFFKCMGSTCCFYTNDKNLFRVHIEMHDQNQAQDKDNYLLCSNCNYRAPSVLILINHIEQNHSYERFSCKYCFFRSVNDFQIFYNHQDKYHRGLAKAVIEFIPLRKRTHEKTLLTLEKVIPYYVPVLSCIYCSQKFYVLTLFDEHLKTHTLVNAITRCLKCKEKISIPNIFEHLFCCYGLGLYQCVYCKFGSCGLPELDDHLASKHSDKESYFVERNLSSKHANRPFDPHSVKSLTVKQITKKVDQFEKILVTDSTKLNNSQNVTNLLETVGESDDEAIAVNESNRISIDIVKSALQINNVFSLH